MTESAPQPAGPRRVSQADAVAAAVRLASRHPGETVLIGVDGYGGAGKSTFTAKLAAAVSDAAVVHIDDFASPSVPEWDWTRFREQVLDPLLTGRTARHQRWDWHRDEGAEWYEIPPGRPVVVEGVSSTRLEVAAPWDLTIWVDTPLDERLRRAVERDGPELQTMWLEVWIPSEDAYVAREDPLSRVDLIVRGTEP
jgi:uridine kinase